MIRKPFLKIKILILFLSIMFTLLFANANTLEEKMEEKIVDCDAGDAKACLDAGKIYSAQAYKIKSNDKKSVASNVASFYKKSCHLGDAEGCRAYAMQYTSDKEKEPHKNAAYYFQKACDGGDYTACTMLKMMPTQE